MFNHHQAEITVMQFRGYSLPVHHCSGTFTLSHIISLNTPTRSLSITGHWNVSLPSSVSPWNSIFGLGRRSKYNNKPELIVLHTVKWFQIFLSNMNNSIYYKSFVCTLWNGFKYCYLILIILSNSLHSFTGKWFQVLLCITNNSIKHQ